MLNEEALKHRHPGKDPRLLDITPETKEEVDEALDDQLETMNRDETKLSHADEMALAEFADGYNPMEDDSSASDTLQDYQDQIHDENLDMKKPFGLFDLQSSEEQEHLLNFKKVSNDFKEFQEKKIDCLEKIPKEAWVLRELVICVGRNFSKVKNDLKYEKKKLLARAESRVRRVMAEECYSNAGLDMTQSRSCDLLEKEAIELLWDEMNYPALLKYHKEKYTFTHSKMNKEKFDEYIGFFAELYRRDNELLGEMDSHGEIALINIKKFIDDTTEKYAQEAKENGYDFNIDLAHAGIDDHGIKHSHFHSIGQYDTNFNHPDEESGYHDYNGDHNENVSDEYDNREKANIAHFGGYKNSFGPAATNTHDIMQKYEEPDDNEDNEESESSEEYAQRIKDQAGYVEPEPESDENEDHHSEELKYKKRKLNKPMRSRSQIQRARISRIRRSHSVKRPMRRLPDHQKIKSHQNIRKNIHLTRIHRNLKRGKKSRNLKDTRVVKEDSKKSIADILKDYTYKLPGLKSKKSLAHLLKV